MKITLTTLAGVALLLLSSCDPEPDVRYLYIQPESVVYDIATGKEADNNEVPFNDLLVHIKTPFSQQTVSVPTALPFVTKSYAMHKDMSKAYTVEKMTGIRVVTVKDYDATHLAGSDITDLCMFYNVKKNADTNKLNPVFAESVSLQRVVQDMNLNSEYGYGGIGPRAEFGIKLLQVPATASQQQFRVEFETATPSKFSTTTKQFILKP